MLRPSQGPEGAAALLPFEEFSSVPLCQPQQSWHGGQGGEEGPREGAEEAS